LPSLIVLLAFIYAISGRVALLLALPPSYASAIFPPAGIGLAFVLVYGWRVLPGVFLGSLLLNAWLDLSRGHFPVLDIAAPLSIAIGSTVQALVGKWVYRRLEGGDGARFDSFGALAKFLLGAPFICVSSASLSLAGLVLVGAEGLSAIGTDWLTWWLGDTLGVVLCVPLTLIFIGQPHHLWQRRRLLLGVPVLISIGLCVTVYLKASGWENDQSLREFQLVTERAAAELQTHLASQELVVDELAALMSSIGKESVTQEAFHRIASATLSKTPEVAALEWVPCVSDTERSLFEARQAHAMPGFQITERAADGTMVKASQRSRYFPVTFAEPIKGNHAAVGFDLASNTVRRNALTLAITSGRAVVSAPIDLVQEREQQKGLILVRAVPGNSTCPALVLSVIRLEDFVRKSLPPEAAALNLHVDDLTAKVTVFGHAKPLVASNQRMHVLHFGGRTFALVSTPTAQYLTQHKSWQSLSLVAGCLFGTGLLGVLLLLSSGYAERTERVVQERTNQLESESRKNAVFLRNSSDGTHIVDAQGKLVEVSDSFCRMFGYSRDEMIGMRISDWDAGVQPDQVPAIVTRIMGSQSANFVTQHRRKNGTVFDVEVAVNLVELDGKHYLFASSRDITQRKFAEEALRQSEAHLLAVTDRIPMRVSFIDHAERYQFVNLAYEAAFAKPRAELYGMTVREVLGEGAYSQVAPYIARALAGETLSFDSEITTLEGYRCYRATYVPQFAEDGSTVLGLVAIILDTTTQKIEERRLIELSQLDSLTGLLNHAGFNKRIHEAIERSRASQNLMALMALDVDGFKQVNDTLGHQVGDLLLKGFARRLVKILRANDIIARPGGDEFAILVEGLEETEDAAMIARNIVEAARAPFILGDRTVCISTSIGVAVYAGQPAINGTDLLKLADDLLYEVKRAGRNDFRIGFAVDINCSDETGRGASLQQLPE